MNAFESYIYSIRNTIEDPEKLANKIDEGDKQKMNEAINEAKAWLDNNRSADKEDFEEHQKQLENVCNPIISKVYQANGGNNSHNSENFEDIEL